MPDSVNNGTNPAMMIAAAKKDRLADLGRGDRHGAHLAAKAARRGAPATIPTGAEMCRFLREVPENVFDHDDGGVDHQAEIDGAHRQQIGRFAAQDHQPDGKGQREWNGHSNDDGAAHVAQKGPLQEEDQDDPFHHVMQHGMRRNVNQVAAVVDALDPHAGRENAAVVDLVHFGFDALDGGHAFGAAAHQHDALNDVVGVVDAGDAEPRHVADRHSGDIADNSTGAP